MLHNVSHQLITCRYVHSNKQKSFARSTPVCPSPPSCPATKRRRIAARTAACRKPTSDAASPCWTSTCRTPLTRRCCSCCGGIVACSAATLGGTSFPVTYCRARLNSECLGVCRVMSVQSSWHISDHRSPQ